MKLFSRASVLLFLFASVSGILAQNSFQFTKIVTNNNDTIVGFIDLNNETELFKECRFKQDVNSPITTYTPQTIKMFTIGSGLMRKFVRVGLPSVFGDAFMEVLCEGKICLYYYGKGPIHYFVQQKGESILHGLPFQRTERYVDNGYLKQYKTIETLYHMDTLKMVMQDKPALYADIEKIQNPEKKNLIEIVNKYNSNTLTIHTIKDQKQLNTLNPELLRVGKINLYMQKDSASELHFYIQKGAGTKLIELPFKNLKNQYYHGMLIRSYANKTTNHIDTLKKYMADAAPLFTSIEDISIPQKKKLEKLTDEYNSYIDEKTYNQKHELKRLPLNMDAVPGLVFIFVNPEDPVVRFGSFLDIGLLNSNKHFFFKTGLFVFRANTPLTDRYYTSNHLERFAPPVTTCRIPLQFEFRFPEKTVQPILSIGYNLYLFKEIQPYDKVLLPVISPGINIQLEKRFSIRFGAELEFKNENLLSYTPESLKRASLFAGLQIKL